MLCPSQGGKGLCAPFPTEYVASRHYDCSGDGNRRVLSKNAFDGIEIIADKILESDAHVATFGERLKLVKRFSQPLPELRLLTGLHWARGW